MDLINESTKLIQEADRKQQELRWRNMEEVFLLIYYGGFTYEDAMDLPFDERKWFVSRTQEEMALKEAANGNA